MAASNFNKIIDFNPAPHQTKAAKVEQSDEFC